jgi:hypothetical protein
MFRTSATGSFAKALKHDPHSVLYTQPNRMSASHIPVYILTKSPVLAIVLQNRADISIRNFAERFVIPFETAFQQTLADWTTGIARNQGTRYVRFEVFTAVTMKNGVFWVVTPCGSCKNQPFGGTWRLLHQGDKNR